LAVLDAEVVEQDESATNHPRWHVLEDRLRRLVLVGIGMHERDRIHRNQRVGEQPLDHRRRRDQRLHVLRAGIGELADRVAGIEIALVRDALEGVVQVEPAAQ